MVILGVLVLVDTGKDVSVDHIVDLLPELRVFVRLEHLIRCCVRENSIKDGCQIDGKDDGNAENDPKVNGNKEAIDRKCD